MKQEFRIEIKGSLRSLNTLFSALWAYGVEVEDLPFNGKRIIYNSEEQMREAIDSVLDRADDDLEGITFNGITVSYDDACARII